MKIDLQGCIMGLVLAGADINDLESSLDELKRAGFIVENPDGSWELM